MKAEACQQSRQRRRRADGERRSSSWQRTRLYCAPGRGQKVVLSSLPVCLLFLGALRRPWCAAPVSVRFSFGTECDPTARAPCENALRIELPCQDYETSALPAALLPHCYQLRAVHFANVNIGGSRYDVLTSLLLVQDGMLAIDDDDSVRKRVAAGEGRTPDLRIARPTCCQLRYCRMAIFSEMRRWSMPLCEAQGMMCRPPWGFSRRGRTVACSANGICPQSSKRMEHRSLMFFQNKPA